MRRCLLQAGWKTSRLSLIQGPLFFVRNTKDDPLELKYYPEEIGQIAPQNANVYFLGQVWCWNAVVKNNKAISPIVTNTMLFPLDVEDGHYQVVPICFYNAVIDRTKKYRVQEETSDSGQRTLRIIERKK